MDINELQKMISIISHKKSKCRGNLRLKVLLKVTHDYVRHSWIDGQMGNPQRLQTMLKNSGSEQHCTTSITNESSEILTTKFEDNASEIPKQPVHVSNDSLMNNSLCSCETDNLITEKSLSKTIGASTKETKDKTVETLLKFSNTMDIFADSNISRNNMNLKFSERNLKLQKIIRRLIKESEFYSDTDECNKDNQLDFHKIKRIEKLLNKCKVLLKTDDENQNSNQQKNINKFLKVIQKLLEQCENYERKKVESGRNNDSQKQNYKLERIVRKLKKYKVHVLKDISNTNQFDEN